MAEEQRPINVKLDNILENCLLPCDSGAGDVRDNDTDVVGDVGGCLDVRDHNYTATDTTVHTDIGPYQFRIQRPKLQGDVWRF